MSKNNSLNYLHELVELQVEARPHHPAVIYENKQISYLELEKQANILALRLKSLHIGKGKYVAILVERNDFAYIAMLGILKSGAAYVPLDPEYPGERINYILQDCNVSLLITTEFQSKQHSLDCPNLLLDQKIFDSNDNPIIKKELEPTTLTPDDPCYVIYTSGSTGKPKGVAITHRSVCNYVHEAKRIYDLQEIDRVYQGFSIAFDASIEEIWPTLASGATLISTNDKALRAGAGLIEFLSQQKISFLSTIPTLLSMLKPPVSSLRLLVLGGEVCRQDLITRWSQPGLRIINTYGPTEATVITTYCECHPDKPVSIGKPISNCEIHILNENLQPVDENEEGELCISGIGLSPGYINRPELNQTKFITHPEINKRLYRTGDLCRKLNNGDIQFTGRLDGQIKLRGFRIELAEIEAVIMEYPGIHQTVVSVWEQSPGIEFLVAYIIPEKNVTISKDKLQDFLRSRLAAYMLPGFIEVIDQLPFLTSGKIDRKNLPLPQTNTQANSKNYVPAKTEAEKKLISIWEKLFNKNSISITDDFFYDLGGHSLLAAKAVSLLREESDFVSASVVDIYKNPTIEKLALKLIGTAKQSTTNIGDVSKKVSKIQYLFCSSAQLVGSYLLFAITSWEFLLVIFSLNFISSQYSFYSLQMLSTIVGIFLLFPLALMSFSIALKWLLIGRIKPGTYTLWGNYYLRWWFVQRVQTALFNITAIQGSPLINLYFRLMGAKIGKNCHIGTYHMHSFDLLTLGDNSSIHQEAYLTGYNIKNGILEIGKVTIGKNCFVGVGSVLDINTIMEDGAILEDLSMLPENGIITKNQCYFGSPAQPMKNQTTKFKNQNIENNHWLKNFYYGCMHYCGLLWVGVIYTLAFIPGIAIINYFYDKNQIIKAIVIGVPLGGLLFICVLFLAIIVSKKILINKVKPGTYKLRSFFYVRKWIFDQMLALQEIDLMAESLYFPTFMRLLGMKLGKRVELSEMPHLTPDLITIDDESFTASTAIINPPQIHLGRITYAYTKIGKRTFIGNYAVLPLGTQLGDQCLVGCMSVPPPKTTLKTSNSAWLGSPAILLPHREIVKGFSEKVTFKPPKYLYLLRGLIEFFRIILPIIFYFLLLLGFFISLDFLENHNYSLLAIILLLPLCEIAILLSLTIFSILLKWVLMGSYKPSMKPLWSIFIWKRDLLEHLHNLFFGKVIFVPLLGTPFIALFLRLLGTKIGKRVYIGTLIGFAEHDLIDIGDNTSLNDGCTILTHLYEDRIFKMDKIKIKNGCSVGIRSKVTYDTIMEENSVLGNLSLLMKGERLPPNTYWEGIPSQAHYSEKQSKTKG